MPEQIPANVDFPVVVGTTTAVAEARLQGRAIAILGPEPLRRNRNWDDFGLNFFAALYLISDDGRLAEIHVRFMLNGINRTSPELSRLIAERGEKFPIDQMGNSFVSLIPDEHDYGTVIDLLGFEAGVSALRKLGDIVVARIEGSDQATLALGASVNFHEGAIRASGGYTALRRGGRHFRRTPALEVEDLAGNFSFQTTLPCADNPYDIDFEFLADDVFHDRTAVLIGRNGVGKTQLLKALVDGLTPGETPVDGEVRARFEPQITPRRVLVFSAVPTDPFPRHIGAWHGIDYEYFAVNATHEERADPLLQSLFACLRDEAPPTFGADRTLSRESLVREVLTKLGVWHRLLVPLTPLAANPDPLRAGIIEVQGQRYFAITTHLAEQAGLYLLQQIDWTRPPIVITQSRVPQSLSSGEYAMMRFAVQAIASVERGSLLLLDEPETHLHPNFVSDLMDLLAGVLEATGSIAIIATHSAYVVREAPRQRVRILTLEDRQILVDEPRMQTFGASIDKISQFVFGDTSMSHRFQRKLEEWADRVGREIGIDRVISVHGEDLNSESLSFIARRLRDQREPQ